ncbi:hypothetical protein NARC_80059 [Candidatus Nitrosocosmicus arcticus]|uniref:Uncharacterized protein n=1 Tax=Candidatus Nitrosocosmicus arcticus TaxID=2035267 RepID=A0A557SUQ0_9ARCH|nr:hypothetical protein NARC_80059 [Candidatus Nitrosocosmicus arcticus]
MESLSMITDSLVDLVCIFIAFLKYNVVTIIKSHVIFTKFNNKEHNLCYLLRINFYRTS